VLFFEYLQWLACEQWRDARAGARAKGIALFGDLPFMVNLDSADVWLRQQQFRLDVSVGAPPDAFSASGQNWGVPAYDWDAMAKDDFAWIRERARRGAALFEGYRVDHLVGFYRTYCRPRDGSAPFFSPASRAAQLRLGERVLRVFAESGAEIIAEDLGTVPQFVRLSLKRLGVPGYRVFRWEREWSTEGHPFCDPLKYAERSVVASGTHDTEPMTIWWEQAPADERTRAAELALVRRLGLEDERRGFERPEIAGCARIHAVAVRIGRGRKLELGTGHTEKADRIAVGQRTSLVGRDDIIRNGGNAGGGGGKRTKRSERKQRSHGNLSL